MEGGMGVQAVSSLAQNHQSGKVACLYARTF
jgi:hypothetical protein